MNKVVKKPCIGCPFDYGHPATEMAYNLGCLPTTGEVHQGCEENGQTWACHSAPKAVCHGYAEMYPERNNLPLRVIEGVHYPKPYDNIVGVPPMQGPSSDWVAKIFEKNKDMGYL